jgi:hypothetical protein
MAILWSWSLANPALTYTLPNGTIPICFAFSRSVTHHITGQRGTVEGTSPPSATPCAADNTHAFVPDPNVGEAILFGVRYRDLITQTIGDL